MENNIVSFKIGSFNCTAISDGADPDRNVLLIQAGQQQVLIDTGVGHGFVWPTGLLLDKLQAAGFPLAAIDVVIFSHADVDHIGGAVDERGNPTFPNARHVLLKTEWAFWSADPERLRPSEAYDEEFRWLVNTIPPTRLVQLRDKLELVESEDEIVPGIRLIAAPGHTPGYSIISVSSGGRQLIFVGDLVYDPKDIESSDYVSVFDFDPEQVVVTRNQVFERAARDGALLMAYHLPFPGLGYVSKQEHGWGWQAFEIPG
jgi:glyoxylase-like metal-dependent hydrolase (beta-lactamase superfamily II)